MREDSGTIFQIDPKTFQMGSGVPIPLVIYETLPNISPWHVEGRGLWGFALEPEDWKRF